MRTAAIAVEVGCQPQAVRERIHRFNAEGVEGLGDRPGAGRKRRLTEAERGRVIALVAAPPPGRLVQEGDVLVARDEAQPAHWTLDSLAAAAHERGIVIGRSPVRRILTAEGVRWRAPRRWTTSTDPEFAPKGRRSSRAPPPRRTARRPSASMSSAQ